MKVSKVVSRRRMLWTLLGLAVLFGALAVRLAYVQLTQGEKLSERAEDLWRRNIPFTAKRGEILDREGWRWLTTSAHLRFMPFLYR